MNRDEALNKTIGILTYHQVNFCKSKEAVANMNEIIEALEKINQEPCGDVVNRQAVLEVIKKCHCEEWVKADIGAPIEALSSVTPQPKMGKWIMSDDGLYRPICNRCAAHPWKGYIPSVEEATNVFKFCPNCGAKMQEAEE